MRQRIRPWLAAAFGIAGPISLFLWPLPIAQTLLSFAAGAVAGALAATREQGLRFVAFGVYLIGARLISDSLPRRLDALWWEPMVVVTSTMICVFYSLRSRDEGGADTG